MPKRILKDFDLEEISGVDRPAQPTAKMTIIKRRTDEADPTLDLIKSFCAKSEGSAITFADALMADKVSDALWPMNSALSSSVRSILGDGAMEGPAKAAAINLTIDQFAMSMRAIVNDDSNPLTKFAMNLIAGKVGETHTDEGTPMAKTAEQEKLETLQKSFDEQSVLLAAAALIAKLNDNEKAFMENMDDDAKKAFTALSEDERKGKMDLAKREDETLTIAGTVVSKKVVGGVAFQVMKAQQAQIDEGVKAMALSKAEVQMAGFVKRAGDDYAHLPGTTAEIGEVLKFVDGASENVKKSIEAVFKAAETTTAAGFTTQGSTYAKSAGAGSAEEQLDTLAKAYDKEHNVGYAAAYSEVVEKNVSLYEASLGQA